MSWINSFVPIDSEVVKGSKDKAEGSKKRTKKGFDEESVKRQKLEDDAEKAELRLSDGSSKMYKVFTTMLNDFDRQDLIELYSLVIKRFKTTRPEGSDRLLWGDLMTIFEPKVKTASTPKETQKPLLNDEDGEEVDVHIYQVNPKVSHLHDVKRIFRYLKGQPKLGIWYPKDYPFDLVAYNDSDYSRASLDRKSTTGGCQFLGCRLISWQCKKQTVVANSTTEAKYVVASSCHGQVLWIQNQLLDYGYNFMHTKIFIDNNSTICIFKNPVFHSKTKHIEIRHHFIRDCNDKKLIQMVKIHTDKNVADLLTKAFDATIKVKTINGEVQLQALVDGKKIIITESTVRRDLQLDDEEGTDCLPNATIFEELTRIGYEKLSQKLTFYKAFFSSQWKFLIHTILQCLSSKTTAWNEFSSTIASSIICLATNQKFNFSKYIFESMVKNLENVSGKFLMYPRFVQVFMNQQLKGMPTHKRIYVTPSHAKKIFRNIKRVGKGFSRRETPLFQTMMKQKTRKPKRKDTKIPLSSVPGDNVVDEAVNEEMDDSLERAATTAIGLDAEHDRGNINKTQSKATHNEPSSPGTSSCGGPKRQETMRDTIA
ncbi:hypothetical protein Tco_0300790 [Tanacetum coccineum]